MMKTVRNVVRMRRIQDVAVAWRRVNLLAFSLVLVVVLIGCSSDVTSSALSADAPNATKDNAASQEVQAASNQGGTREQTTLPGTEEFALSRAELVTSIEEVESLIAECMSEAGFEYIAADYNTVRTAMVSDKSLPGYSESRYMEQFGFGISTLYTGHPPQQAQAGTPARTGLGEQNVQIFNNLSPADQVAYNRTLLGENTDATFAVAIETEDLTRTGGCTRRAIEQVFTPEQLTTTYVNPKDALIEQDPRMIAAIAEFGQCMRDAGFDYNLEREIEPDLRRRVQEITGGAPIESLSEDARAALAALQEEERALAIVTFRCEDRILDPVESQVERELYAGRQG